MTTQKPISKSPISDAFLSKNADGDYLANSCFCERYVDDFSSPFTGKEKDPETGYSYFGARYLEHELMTCWLSVDPLADKNPSISPYNYCHWNPLKLIDADGKEDYEVNRMGYITKCKDQSHAVEGQDRLFAKPLIGHVRFDKNGNTKSAFVSVIEGVLSHYEKGPIGRQENRGMMYDNSIIYNGYYVFKNRRIEKLPWER